MDGSNSWCTPFRRLILVSFILNKRVALLATLLILTLFPTFSLASGFIYDGDKGIVLEKTVKKIEEIGQELYKKLGVSTILVVKKRMTKEEFLAYKEKYSLSTPYVLWIFSKSTDKTKAVGYNNMFNSKDLEDKYSKDSILGSLFTRGSFTSIYVVHKSKIDPTSAAFLNGYGDLADMIADSYNIELDSSMGSDSKTTIDILRIVIYSIILFTIIILLRNKFRKKD